MVRGPKRKYLPKLLTCMLLVVGLFVFVCRRQKSPENSLQSFLINGQPSPSSNNVVEQKLNYQVQLSDIQDEKNGEGAIVMSENNVCDQSVGIQQLFSDQISGNRAALGSSRYSKHNSLQGGGGEHRVQEPFNNLANSGFAGNQTDRLSNNRIEMQEFSRQLHGQDFRNQMSKRNFLSDLIDQDVNKNVSKKLSFVWRHKFFVILGAIGKVVRYARMTMIQFRPGSYLSSLHFEIINDQAYEYKSVDDHKRYFNTLMNKDKIEMLKEQKHKIKGFRKYLRSQVRSFYAWSSECLLKNMNLLFGWQKYVNISQKFFKYWDVLLMVVMLTEVMLLSMIVAFDESISQQTFDQIQIGLLCVLGLDIVLCFFKGFQEKGRFQTEPRACFWNYFFGNFFLDVVNLLCYFIAYRFDNMYLYTIYILYLTKKFYRYKEYVTDVLQLSDRFGSEQMKLLELVFTTIYFSHLFGCVWYSVGVYSINNPWIKSVSDSGQLSWIQTYQVFNMTWQAKYIVSIFWVFTTMTTIGFGDIVPQNSFERIIAIVIMILSVFIFAYTVNSIGSLLSSMNEKEYVHIQRLKTINSYMNSKRISDHLQTKIRYYLDYIYKEEQESNKESYFGGGISNIFETQQMESCVLQILNKNLTNELLAEVNLKVLNKMKIFSRNMVKFSDQFLSEVSLQVKEKTFMPDDHIHSEQNQSNAIYFISKGELKLTVSSQNKQQSNSKREPTTISILKAGQSFGQYHFLSQDKSPYVAIPTCVTILNFLRFSDFIKILRKYTDDYERFCMAREQLLLAENFDQLNITCSLCSWGNHQETNCPLVQYKPKRYQLLGKLNHSKPIINRNTMYQRQNYRKPNSLQLLPFVQEQANEFQIDNLEIDSQTQQEKEIKNSYVIQNEPIEPIISPIQGREKFTRTANRKRSTKIFDNHSQNQRNHLIMEDPEFEQNSSNNIASLDYIEDEEEDDQKVSTPIQQYQRKRLNKLRFPQPEFSGDTTPKSYTHQNGSSAGKIKGDLIEIDKLCCFNTYRQQQNYPIVIDQYNQSRQIHRFQISSSEDRRFKRRSYQKFIFSSFAFSKKNSGKIPVQQSHLH